MTASNDDGPADAAEPTTANQSQPPAAAELTDSEPAAPADSADDEASAEAVESNQPVEPIASAAPDEEDDWDEVVIGARLREAARIYHFSAPPGQVYAGDYVVVDVGRGEQLARVVTVPDEDEYSSRRRRPRGVRSILRLADGEDRDRAAAQQRRADVILRDLRAGAVRSELDMYPVAVELTLNGDQGNAHFQAPDHVDFRDLVREIEDRYDLRLHMQLVHHRDRAKLVDGYDICGLRLCCSSWMTTFPKVGIRVAKDQNLSLNPDAISGVCGRLLCCLTFEHETYREMRGTLPRLGKRVSTPVGMGKVIKLDILQQKVTIALDDHAQRVDVPAAEIGLAVRTEEAPNQALIEAEEREQQQAEALRRAAAPQPEAAAPAQPRRSRQRRRSQRRSSPRSEERPEERRGAPANTPPTSESAPATAETDQQPAKPRSQRKQRRRRPRVVNTDNGPAPEQSSDNVAQPPKRRRQRRRQRQSDARNQPSNSDND